MLFAVALFLSLSRLASESQAYAGQVRGKRRCCTDSQRSGATVGSITVTDVVDPFTDFDPNYAPEEGSRYVAVTVAFDADAGQRFDIQPSSIVLQDDQGFIVNQAYISLPSDALSRSSPRRRSRPVVASLASSSFPSPRRDPARVFLQPQGNQLVLLADLSNAPNPAIGEAVAIHDAEGGSGTVTVHGRHRSLRGPGSRSGTARGLPVRRRHPRFREHRRWPLCHRALRHHVARRYWGLLELDLRLSAGRSDRRSGHYERQLAAGDRLSGEIFFAVPVGVDLAGLYASPTYGQYIEIADLSGEVASSAAEATPFAPATEMTPTAVPQTEAAPATPAEASACADFEQWLSATRDRIQQARSLSAGAATISDLDILSEDARQFDQLASDQAASTYPEAAGPVNKALVATLRAFADAINQFVASADSAGTSLGESDAMTTLNAATTRLAEIEQRLDLVTTGCAVSA